MIDLSLFTRERVDAALASLLAAEDSSLHGYTPASGLPALRSALAEALRAQGFPAAPERIYITCGLSAGRAIVFRALPDAGDELLFLSPPDAALRAAAEAAGLTVAAHGAPGARCRLAVLPGGAPVSDGLSETLRAAEAAALRPVWLLAENPAPSPALTSLPRAHDACVLNGDFGPALAGECIGYLAVAGPAAEADALCAAIAGAGRAMGYVNPPSLIQRAVLACLT